MNFAKRNYFTRTAQWIISSLTSPAGASIVNMPENNSNWKFVCILLCAVGFFKSMRPSEPFLILYLLGPRVNLTMDEVVTQVLPVATYSSLLMLLIVLLFTDFLRYKPVIVFEGLTFIVTYLLLTLGQTIEHMQLAEFFYAVSISCEVAYYTYMYTKVSGEHYQKVTSYTRAAVLIGMFSSGIVGQILILTKTMDYYELNFITLTSACATLLLALALPRVPTSLYFHQVRIEENAAVETANASLSEPISMTVRLSEGSQNVEAESTVVTKLKNMVRIFRVGLRIIGQDLKQSYSKSEVVKWSVWWAFGTCLHNQVLNYIQPLWENILPSVTGDVDIYNGAVESACTFLGAVAALAVGFIPVNWSLHGELALAGVSILDAACLCLLSLTEEIWVAYGSYVAFRVAYQLLITIASFQVAKDLKPDTYSLIFGFNAFGALVIQTILVFVLVDEKGFAADPRTQFLVYAIYSLIMGVVFFLTAIITFVRKRSRLGITNRQHIDHEG